MNDDRASSPRKLYKSESESEAEHKLADGRGDNSHRCPPETLLREVLLHELATDLNAQGGHATPALRQASLDQALALFDYAPVAFLILNDHGLIAEANLGAANMFGVERNCLLGVPFEYHVVASDLQRWQKLRSRALKREGNQTLDLLLSTPTAAFPARLDCRRRTAFDGTSMLFVSIADISEWKRAEEALHKSEVFSRDILDSVPSEIAVLDGQGVIISVNSAWQRFAEENGATSAGGEANHGIGRNYLEVCQSATGRFSEGANDVKAGIEAVLARRQRSFVHEYACHHCGEQRWFSMSATPLGSHGSGAVIAHTNITERKLAEIQLRLSEDRLRLAKEAAHLGVFDHAIAEGAHEWDARVRELWGVEPDEVVDFDTFMAGIHPDDRAVTKAAVERALDPHGRGEYQAEYRVVGRRDGLVRHIVANGRVSFADGKPVRLTGTVRDVSVQKKLELVARERRSEMELLVNQQVAAHTAAAIAHELNQPLVAVSAYSEAALRMLSEVPQNTERLRRALNGAVDQAQRAGRTLHELMDFLQRGDTVPEAVDLNGAVLEALALAAEGGYADFRQVVDLEHDLRPVLANRLQLQKVLIILLQNSVDAMRGGGVETAEITITVRTMAGGNLAHVTVQDTGPGLDPDTVHRIFEPFFTTKPEGIGLGLAISRALIEAHGGQLWAELIPGPGATFHFTLPFAS